MAGGETYCFQPRENLVAGLTCLVLSAAQIEPGGAIPGVRIDDLSELHRRRLETLFIEKQIAQGQKRIGLSRSILTSQTGMFFRFLRLPHKAECIGQIQMGLGEFGAQPDGFP